MGPYGSKNFKTLPLPQITFESFQTFSDFVFTVVLTNLKYCFGFWKFCVSDFSDFSPLYPMGKPKTSIIRKSSGRRNGVKFGSPGYVFNVYA